MWGQAMDQILTSSLTLAVVRRAFAGLAYSVWRSRQRRPAPAAPGRFSVAGEYRLPKLPRRAEAEPDDVEISPSRLARIGRKAPPDMPEEGGYDAASDPDPAPPLDTEQIGRASCRERVCQ